MHLEAQLTALTPLVHTRSCTRSAETTGSSHCRKASTTLHSVRVRHSVVSVQTIKVSVPASRLSVPIMMRPAKRRAADGDLLPARRGNSADERTPWTGATARSASFGRMRRGLFGVLVLMNRGATTRLLETRVLLVIAHVQVRCMPGLQCCQCSGHGPPRKRHAVAVRAPRTAPATRFAVCAAAARKLQLVQYSCPSHARQPLPPGARHRP